MKILKRALRIQKKTGVGIIFAVNHVSELDPIIVTAGVAPRTFFQPMFYVSAPTKEFKEGDYGWRNFFYGKNLFKAFGAFSLRRGKNDYEKSLRVHIDILKQGYNLTIFPEGKLLKNADINNARGGVAFISEATNAVVVPVHIQGIRKMNSYNFFHRKRSLILSYKEPMQIVGSILLDSEQDKYKKAAQKIVEEIYNG